MSRELIWQLREQQGQLAFCVDEEPLSDWARTTRRLAEEAFVMRPDLHDEFAQAWPDEGDPTNRRRQYARSLDRFIRALNRTDEVDLTRSPVFLFTGLGILFMFLLVISAWLYYQWMVVPR